MTSLNLIGEHWRTLPLFPVIRDHWVALLVFSFLSFLWIGDTLVLDRDLSAFDIILRLPNWQSEYTYQGVQDMILSDSPQAHYPERKIKWGAMAAGHRLNYNPYIFSGLEDSAQGVGGFITSPFQLFMEVDEAIDWSTWLRLTLAGLFMYTLLVGVGTSSLSAIFGGVIWAFNMHQLVWLEFPQHLAAQLWIPLIFYLDYQILKHGFTKARVAGLLLTNLFFYTSGYPQIVLYTYICIGIFNTVYLLSASGLKLKQRLFTWAAVHLVFLIFAVFLLPKVLLVGELIQDGLRGAQTFRAGLSGFSHDFGSIITLIKNILPDIADFKRLYSPDYLGGIWGVKYHGPAVVVGFAAYFGLASLILLPFSIPHFFIKDKRAFLLGISAILAFSFGIMHKDPLLIELVNLVPLGGLGDYGRFITLAVFAMSILSAFGLYYVEKHHSGKTILAFAVVTILLMLAPLALQTVDQSIDPSRFRYSYYLSIGLIVILVVINQFKLRRIFAYLLLVFTIVDLYAVTVEFNPRMPDARNFPLTPSLEKILKDDSEFRIAILSRTQIYPPNVLQFYHLPTVGGYWTTAPRRYLDFIDQAYGESQVTANGMLFLFHGNMNVLRGLGTKYLISDQEIESPLTRLIPDINSHTYLYEFVAPLPRLHCASDVTTFSDETGLLENLGRLYSSQDRPLALTGEMKNAGKLTDACSVEAIRTSINSVTLTVSSDKPTYIIVPYNRSRHWHATVNNKTVEILDANYALMAIPIEPGTSNINLYYQNSLSLWFAVSQILLGLVVILLALSGTPGRHQRAILISLSLVIIIVALMEFPLFQNHNIPEREFNQNVIGS
jgi:hypothetical protein